MKTMSKTIILACCLIGLRASAQLGVTYSASDWNSVVNPASVTSLNFEGIIGSALDPNAGLGLDNYTYFSSPPGLTLGGVNFQYTDPNPGLLFVTGDGGYAPQAVLTPQDFNANASGYYEDGMTTTFSSPVTAFSTTVETFFGSPFIWDVGGNTYTQSSTSTTDAGLAFVGFTSSTPFTSVTVTDPNEFAMIFGNLDYGSATGTATAPDEFSTAWTLGLGLVGCGVFRRFHR